MAILDLGLNLVAMLHYAVQEIEHDREKSPGFAKIVAVCLYPIDALSLLPDPDDGVFHMSAGTLKVGDGVHWQRDGRSSAVQHRIDASLRFGDRPVLVGINDHFDSRLGEPAQFGIDPDIPDERIMGDRDLVIAIRVIFGLCHSPPPTGAS